MDNKSWNEKLDEMLADLNEGNYVDQSIDEFEQTIDDNVLSVKRATRRSYNTTATNVKNTYRNVVPHINRTVEATNYPTRYAQITTCLENIVYNNYPEEKKAGYNQCIQHYLDMVHSCQSLKDVDITIVDEMKEYKAKVKTTEEDDFLRGYYDALLMVKKVLNASRLARLQELANKVGN